MNTENEKLRNMLKEGKITENDFQLLSTALDKRKPCISRLFTLAINPFQKIAGWYALFSGILVMCCMSYLGVIAKVYFPGILAVLNASTVKNPAVPINFSWGMYQNFVSWIILSILFIITAKIFKQRQVRLIDFFGTVALSRFPFLVLVVFISIIRVVNPAFMEIDITKGFPIHSSLSMVAFSFVVILCAAWQLTTYFYALKESSGLTGKKLWISFIVAIILGDIISSPLAMIFF